MVLRHCRTRKSVSHEHKQILKSYLFLIMGGMKSARKSIFNNKECEEMVLVMYRKRWCLHSMKKESSHILIGQ